MPYRLLCSLLAFTLLTSITQTTVHAYVDPTTGESHVSQVLTPAFIPERNWDRGHRGVDLSLGTGSEVLASDDGVVAFAGPVAGTPVLSIDHPDGIRTTYLPLHPHVTTGEQVDKGQVIGTLAHPVPGHTGLHWGARTGTDEYINPLTLLAKPVIRLKPV